MIHVMSPIAPICLAICGFAAATSAFVVQPQITFSPFRRDRHAAAFTGYSNVLPHVSGVKQDTASDIGTSSSNDKQTDLLDRKKFIADMDESLSKISKGTVTTSSPPWKFKGYDVFRQVSVPETKRPGAPVVLLVHGFGCSTVYWRETVRTLTNEGYEVHAIDLLGQGMSAKPTDDIEYSTNLWAQQVDAYARENLAERDVVLIGNSVGSLVSLAAATGDFMEDANCDECYIRQHVAGIGMFNCGIGMNIHNIVKDPKWNPVQRYLLNVTFDILESLIFGNVALLTWILDNVITRDLLRNTLVALYKCAPNPEAKIDDELVDSFYLPAKEAESAQVLRQILTNNAGLTPVELYDKYEPFLKTLPIHLVWGDEDTVVPLKWQVGQFFSALAAEGDSAVTMDVVHGGHILFDEVPDVSNGSMLSWLNTEIAGQELSVE